jgi:hypothetical protein
MIIKLIVNNINGNIFKDKSMELKKWRNHQLSRKSQRPIKDQQNAFLTQCMAIRSRAVTSATLP